MAPTDRTMQFCTDLVAGLADGGVTVVVISPGSRNTPLTLAVAREPRLRDINVRDERSAGFMAVGFGKATGTPAAVLCTSGSAATHYFPAVVEADQDSVPLIVLTADRPLRLRNTYAPQTMNQADLYGTHVKTFIDATDPSADGRALGAQIAGEAIDAIAGAIHCNVPLDEPLVPEALPKVPEPHPLEPPVVEYSGPTDTLAGLVGHRVLIVASGHQANGFAEALDTTARALGAPIIADPRTPVHGPNVIHHGDLLVSARQADTSVLDD
ncbi:MAG: thiamine pyrophosphate-binding protein, partial [Acidimicrobiia bacterium]